MPKANYGFKGDTALTLTQAIEAGATVSSQDYGYFVQLGGITPLPEPPTDDPYYQKVALLAHLNSKTNSAVIDSSPAQRETFFDGGAITTASGDQSPVGGGGAIQLNTNGPSTGGAYFSMLAHNTGINAGTGDFTLEWWAKFSSTNTLTNGEGIILTSTVDGWAGGSAGKWRISVRNQQDASTGNVLKRRLSLSYFNQSPVRLENVWSAYIDDFLDTWTHYAISRTGGVTKVFANGQQLTLGVHPAYDDPYNPFASTATSASDSANWLFPMPGATQFGQLGMVLFGYTDYKIAGLVDEVRYTIGIGRYSSGSVTVPTAPFPDSGPVIAPDAPTNLVATAGDAQIAMTWTAPARNGGAAITDYIVQYSTNDGSTWTTFADGTGTTASATITSLTNGTGYRVRVAAVNSAGTGDYATSGTVTPSLPITITQQPLNTYTSTTSATATLSVAATGGGGNLTYQWQFYGPDYPNSDYNNQWRNLPSQTASSVQLSSNYITGTLGNYDFDYSPSIPIRCAIAAPGGSPTYTQTVRFLCLQNVHMPYPYWYGSNGTNANSGQPQTMSPASGESVRLDLSDYPMGGIDMSWFSGNDVIVKIQVATTGYTSGADWTDLSSTGYRGYFSVMGYDIPASTGTKYYRAIAVVNWPFNVTNGTSSFTPSSPHIYSFSNYDVLQVTWPVTVPDPILYMPFDSTLHDVSNANAANNLQFAGNGPVGDSGASIDTSLKQVGAGSLRLNGVNGMRSTPSPTAPALARDNFCLEWWQNFDSPGTAGRKLIDWLGDTYASQFRVESSGSGWRVVIERLYNDGDGGAFRTQTLSYSHATGWHHIAFVRQSGTWRLYVDGVQQVSAAIPTDADAFEPNTEVSFATGRIGIGANASTSFSSTVIPAGNVDEFRLTRNAKYPNGTTFTPS